MRRIPNSVLVRFQGKAKLHLRLTRTAPVDKQDSEIHAEIRRLADAGTAVLFASSELEEVLMLADRVVVMHEGRVAGELPAADATEERVMHLATGGTSAGRAA